VLKDRAAADAVKARELEALSKSWAEERDRLRDARDSQRAKCDDLKQDLLEAREVKGDVVALRATLAGAEDARDAARRGLALHSRSRKALFAKARAVAATAQELRTVFAVGDKPAVLAALEDGRKCLAETSAGLLEAAAAADAARAADGEKHAAALRALDAVQRDEVARTVQLEGAKHALDHGDWLAKLDGVKADHAAALRKWEKRAERERARADAAAGELAKLRKTHGATAVALDRAKYGSRSLSPPPLLLENAPPPGGDRAPLALAPAPPRSPLGEENLAHAPATSRWVSG